VGSGEFLVLSPVLGLVIALMAATEEAATASLSTAFFHRRRRGVLPALFRQPPPSGRGARFLNGAVVHDNRRHARLGRPAVVAILQSGYAGSG
jgi:hypothetical protein